VLHEVLHCVGPQAYAPQDDVVTVWQVPVPLQVRGGVYVVPLHESGTHCTPLAYL
jgi:hypothetical protein